MKQLILILFFVLLNVLSIKAQDNNVSLSSDREMAEDSLSVMPAAQIMFSNPLPNRLALPSILSPDQPGFYSKEEKAALINAMTAAGVYSSVGHNLSLLTPHLKQWQKVLLFVSGFFLPYTTRFKEGYVPLMNSSFPFIYAKIPGQAPYNNPYSPENFPQCIRSEYDPATGTYKQVMVDWSEVQKNMSLRFNSYLDTAPIPDIPVTPVERMIR